MTQRPALPDYTTYISNTTRIALCHESRPAAYQVSSYLRGRMSCHKPDDEGQNRSWSVC
jgi:hypothetical protein